MFISNMNTIICMTQTYGCKKHPFFIKESDFSKESILKWGYSTLSFNFLRLSIIRNSPFVFGLTKIADRKITAFVLNFFYNKLCNKCSISLSIISVSFWLNFVCKLALFCDGGIPSINSIWQFCTISKIWGSDVKLFHSEIFQSNC